MIALGSYGWFYLAVCASLCAAIGIHAHQRLKGASASTALWMKTISVCIAAPVLAQGGLPEQPRFYILAVLAALCWAINDLLYFNAIARHGGALIARLMPLAILISFVLWFAVDPGLLAHYLQQPARFAAIGLILGFAVLCAFELRRCPTSASALRSAWAMIALTVTGTMLMKCALNIIPQNASVFVYIGIDAALGLCFYLAYFGMRDRQTLATAYGSRGLRTGFVVGLCLTGGVVFRIAAQRGVDNPAYVSMVNMLDVVWLMALSRLSGWTDNSNKLTGLGIAAAAILLAAAKIH